MTIKHYRPLGVTHEELYEEVRNLRVNDLMKSHLKYDGPQPMTDTIVFSDENETVYLIHCPEESKVPIAINSDKDKRKDRVSSSELTLKLLLNKELQEISRSTSIK